MKSYISETIRIPVDAIINEISSRQGMPWNDGRISNQIEFQNLKELFLIMNSGIPREDFFFQGDIFRIHTRYVSTSEHFDSSKEERVSRISSDGSFSVLPRTEYSDILVAFSKSFDFTKRSVYNKVCQCEKSIMIHANTKNLYGIDINALLNRFRLRNERYEGEQEILFPLLKDYIIKEYKCSPNRFKYYMRGLLKKN